MILKKIVSIAMCGVMTLTGAIYMGLPAVSYGDTYRANTERHWAESYLNNLVKQDVMRGDDEGNLKPDNYITRAEFVTMMNRAFKYVQKGQVKMPFNDVDEEAWYYDEIAIAKSQGYFNGIYSDTAGPNTNLKREEAVTLLCRALKIQGDPTDTFKYSDSKEFSAYSKAFINAATEKEFLSGYPDRTFRPQAYMTRGEMAKVLSEVAGEIVSQPGNNYIGYANRNVSIVKTGSTLENTIIPGDLYITAGTGTGYTTLKNVTVLGELIISGTGNAESGEVSVLLTDCDIKHLIVDAHNTDLMSIKADGGSVIEKTTIRSNTYLEEDNNSGIAYKDVELNGPSGTTAELTGNFENVIIKAEGNKLNLNKGSIGSLTVDEDAVKGTVMLKQGTSVDALFCDTATTVTGTGKIEELSVNSNGTNVAMLPEHIYIRPDVTAVINGKTMTALDAEANNAEPEFMSGYPRYEDLQATSIKILVKVNKPGKVYWAIKNIDLVNAGMSQDDVLNPDSRYVVKSGNVNVVGDRETTINVTGLQSGVNYEAYLVFVDMKDQRTELESESFKTVDVVAPQFLNSTPRVVDSTKSSFTMLVMPSKNTKLYWAALPNKAVSPTIESLAELKVTGAFGKGIISGLEMNDPRELLLKGTDGKEFSENETYDIYMVLKDESGNLSRMAKVIDTTRDETAPVFMEGYPWNEPGSETGLNIRHMLNEQCTLYWAVYPFDNKFPPVEDEEFNAELAVRLGNETDADKKAEIQNELTKELCIRAITTGQRSLKSGRLQVNEKVDGRLNIPGLEKATPYDVYFVAMDRAGNYSEIASLKGIKTMDKTAPVAHLEFDRTLEGNPLVNTEISVVFDEIVYYDGPDADTRLVEYNNTDKHSLREKAEVLNKIFDMHDLLSVVRPDYMAEMDPSSEAATWSGINYRNAVIGEKEGHTYVTFGQNCFNSGNGLNSGGSYQFEISNITDSDKNAISQKTLLPAFKVVPPQVYFSRYNGPALVKENHLGFSLKRAAEVYSDKYFDVYIISDKLITFDLYRRVPVYENGQPKTDASGQPVYKETKIVANARINPNQGRSVAAMIVNPGGGENQPASVDKAYQKFMDVDAEDYRMELTSFDSVPALKKDGVTSNVESWDGELNLSVMAVVGEPSELTNLGTKVMNRQNPEDVIRSNATSVVVSNPEVYTTTRYYSDTAQPELVGDIKYEVYDTACDVIVMTDKKATIYYAAVPLSDLVKNQDTMGHVTYKDMPTVDQIIAGKPAYINSKTGAINCADGQVEYEELIEGLTPETDYKFFYVIKGVATDGLKVNLGNMNGSIPLADFTTLPAKTPVIYDFMPTGESTSTTADMKGTADNDGRVYWVMYTAGLYPDRSDGSPYFTVDQVMELSNAAGTIVDSGNFNVSTRTDINQDKADIQFKFTCSNMEPSKSYDVFITMQSEYSGIKSSKVVKYGNLRSLDNVAPYITNSASTTITNSQVAYHDNKKDVDVYKYDGRISLRFSEPLYYKNALGGDRVSPLSPEKIICFNMAHPADPLTDKNILGNGYFPMQSNGWGGVLYFTGHDDVNDLKARVYVTDDVDEGKNVYPVTGIDFQFKNVMDGDSIGINGEIYDKAGWHSGQFLMVFDGEAEEFVIYFPTEP